MQACRQIVRSDDVWGALRHVVEPNLGVNVVDLGLVYGVETDGDDVRVVLVTLGPQEQGKRELEERVERGLSERLPGLGRVEIEVLRDRLWHPGLMSEETRRRLGL
jgi:metal-sulfur cluster biosynthetic enzyme